MCSKIFKLFTIVFVFFLSSENFAAGIHFASEEAELTPQMRLQNLCTNAHASMRSFLNYETDFETTSTKLEVMFTQITQAWKSLQKKDKKSSDELLSFIRKMEASLSRAAQHQESIFLMQSLTALEADVRNDLVLPDTEKDGETPEK